MTYAPPPSPLASRHCPEFAMLSPRTAGVSASSRPFIPTTAAISATTAPMPLTAAARQRAFSYTPEELASITLSLYRSNYIEGLFLSSGAGRNEDDIMEKMVETVRRLRHETWFPGIYSSQGPAGSLSGSHSGSNGAGRRVSINLEASTASHMNEMCATKSYESDILQRQRYIRDLKTAANLPAGQTTQLVVGAGGESDEEIFKRILYEYKEIGLQTSLLQRFLPPGGHAIRAQRGAAAVERAPPLPDGLALPGLPFPAP